jgi:ATP-dependent helicase HrpA
VHELGSGKVTIKAFPALIDKGESVDLCLLDTEYKARLATRNGVVRLLMLASKQQMRYLQKELLQDPGRLIQLNSLGKREDLLEQLIKRAYAIAFKLDENLPRDQQAFAILLETYRSEVIDIALKLQDLVYKIVTIRYELIKLLQQKFAGVQDLPVKQDVSQQLEHLVHRNFLQSSPRIQLQQFPRYLQAIMVRLEKYPLQTSRDKEHTKLISQLWQQYSERRQYYDKHEIEHEGLDEYRWLLEEFRVSLFAQGLGTRVPISEKRLQKYWLELIG